MSRHRNHTTIAQPAVPALVDVRQGLERALDEPIILFVFFTLLLISGANVPLEEFPYIVGLIGQARPLPRTKSPATRLLRFCLLRSGNGFRSGSASGGSLLGVGPTPASIC